MDDVMWGNVDDGFPDHPKVLELLDQEDGAAALGLWTLVLCWAHKQADPDRPELAGVIPPSIPRRFMGDAGPHLAKLLVNCRAGRGNGLWEEDGAGWRIHEFAEWQNLGEWAAKRAQAKRAITARWQRHAASQFADQGGDTPVSTDEHTDVDTGEHTDVGTSVIPTTPHHTTTDTPNGVSKRRGSPGPSGDLVLAERGEVEELCRVLADRIESNGSKRPAITKAWRDSCRLLLDKDLVRPEYPDLPRRVRAVRACIDWCQRDEFWRANILSMPTLRKQFDRLRLAAGRQGVRAGGSKDDRVAAMLSRADDLERGT
jgi:hypothetical protein